MSHKVIIPGREMFDSKTNRFFYEDDIVFEIEHSLWSIKKWESKWHTYFIGNDKKTEEQLIDYIKCMTLPVPLQDSVYKKLTKENVEDISKYMEDPMTGTWFGKRKEDEDKTNSNPITNEIIYWWMTELNIPPEYQYWHINQLMTLIKVISIKRDEAEQKSKRKGKKNSQAIDYDRRRKINEARRKRFNTNG